MFVVTHGMNDWLALVLTILTGIGIGALHGFFFARIGVPAFVVTLAGFLGWNGLMLWLLGSSGTINIPPTRVRSHLLGQSSFFMDQAVAGAYMLAASVSAPCSSARSSSSAAARPPGCRSGRTSEIVLRVGRARRGRVRRRVRAEHPRPVSPTPW